MDAFRTTGALSHKDYTVACICPMGVELAPVEAMLNEEHPPLPTSRDQNAYTLGRLGTHNVVVAAMPQIGNNSAALVATQLLNDFPSIRFGLLVGIGGDMPSRRRG
jgi:nucleoside phosphorylase